MRERWVNLAILTRTPTRCTLCSRPLFTKRIGDTHFFSCRTCDGLTSQPEVR